MTESVTAKPSELEVLKGEVSALRSLARLYEALLTQAIFYGATPKWQDEVRTLLDMRDRKAPDGS